MENISYSCTMCFGEKVIRTFASNGKRPNELTMCLAFDSVILKNATSFDTLGHVMTLKTLPIIT